MAMTAYSPSYPVRVDARLDPQLSRGLWLIKWLLVIPHYILLTFLWIAFFILSVVAFFAILFTARYPRAIFDFNVGVMRWSWRVAYYAYGALATDRYPPFSLREDPDYPAHLEVDYPEQLSRGLVLVKWWLLAIPQYIIVGIFVSGGIYLARGVHDPIGGATTGAAGWAGSGGLIALLALIAAIALLFTGTYPHALFDLVLGLNRWVLRVAAYAALMTDQYPPFRLDQGGDDPGTARPHVPAPVSPAPVAGPEAGTGARDEPIVNEPGVSERGVSESGVNEPGANEPGGNAAQRSAVPPAPTSRWGAGRVLAVVLAGLVMLCSFGLLAAGAVAAVANSHLRDPSGFLMTDPHRLSTGTYALASPTLEVHSAEVARNVPHRMFGDAKVSVTSSDGHRLFVGLARAGDAKAYLATVRHATVTGSFANPTYRVSPGRAPATPPGQRDIWVAQASGAGTQSVQAPVSEGHWTVVVMNADGSVGVDTMMSVGATVPGLGALTAVLLSVGGAALLLSVAVIVVALVTAHGATPRPNPADRMTGG